MVIRALRFVPKQEGAYIERGGCVSDGAAVRSGGGFDCHAFVETGIRSRLGLDFREVKVQNEKDESF